MKITRNVLLLSMFFSLNFLFSQKLFKDIMPGSGHSHPYYLGKMPNGALFMAQNDSFGNELWFSDGTLSGTYMLVDANKGPYGSGFNDPFADTAYTLLFIQTDSKQIWATDGTIKGTKKLTTILSYPPYVSSNMLIKYHNKIYFSAMDSFGNDIMITDGTPGGTKGVIDMGPRTGSGPYNYVVCNDKMYFSYADSVNRVSLYKSDGTKSGTKKLLSMIAFNSKILVNGDYLYFIGYSNSGYFALFRFNTITQIHEILYDDFNDRIQNELFFYKQKLYFNTYNNGIMKSWYSDGTPQSHRELTISDTSIHSKRLMSVYEYPNFTVAQLFTDKQAYEYWKLENNGTHLKFILDIAPGTFSSITGNQRPFYKDGKIYFLAFSSQFGNAIWYSDATTENTKIYYNVTNNQSISNLYQINNKTFMSAFLDPAYGEEMYSFEALNTSVSLLPNSNLKVYPNPIKAGQMLNIENNIPVTKVCLIDLNGRIAELAITENKISIPQNLEAGIYTLVIYCNETCKTLKILIQ